MQDIAQRLKQKSDSEKESSNAINSTKFEKDIVSALQGKTDIGQYQSAYAMRIAKMCARKITQNTGGITSIKRNSDKKTMNGVSVLSPLYRRYMCTANQKCNGDPKSDIVLVSQLNGKMLVSMKKQGDAQIASALSGEANAVVSAALGENNQMVKITRELFSSILPKQNYYEIRSKFKDKDFDSILSSLIGLKSGSGTPSSAQIIAFNKFLDSVGIKTKIIEGLNNYMRSSVVRKKIFKEFASGEKRYIPTEKDRSADWFLVWSQTGDILLSDIDQFIDSHYGSFRMNIRDRGNESGGSLRVDVREMWNLDPQQYSKFLIIEKETHKEFDYACLTEGILDSTVSLLKTSGATVAAVYRKFVAAVKALLSMIARLFAKGVAAVLDFLGLEISEMSYSW